MVHSEQLGQAWGPLLVLFVVGLVLTLTRVVTRSITPGLLMHVGYNLTLFSLLYVGHRSFPPSGAHDAVERRLLTTKDTKVHEGNTLESFVILRVLGG